MAAPSVVKADITLVTWLVWAVVFYREVKDRGVLWTGVPRKGVPELGRFWFSSLVLFVMTSKGEVLRQRDLHLDQYFSSLFIIYTLNLDVGVISNDWGQSMVDFIVWIRLVTGGLYACVLQGSVNIEAPA